MKYVLRKTFCALSLGFIFIVAGCVGRGSNEAMALGQITPNQYFTLDDTEGQSVSLDETLKNNKAVLLNFWATWCPPCQEEIPGLISLQSKHKDKGFTVLGVDVGESAQKVSNFMKKVGINYPVLLDKDMKVSEAYRVVGIPTSFLIDSNGKILGVYHSYSESLIRDVEKALQ